MDATQIISPLPVNEANALIRMEDCIRCHDRFLWDLIHYITQAAFWWIKSVTAWVILEFVLKSLLFMAEGLSTQACLRGSALPHWPDKRYQVGVDPRTGKPVRKRVRPPREESGGFVGGGGRFGGGGAGGQWDGRSLSDFFVWYSDTVELRQKGAVGTPMTEEQIAFLVSLAADSPGSIPWTFGVQSGGLSRDLTAPPPSDRMQKYFRNNYLRRGPQ